MADSAVEAVETIIAGYRVTLRPRIGAGSFGQVYKAVHCTRNYTCAVKEISLLRNDRRNERIKRMTQEELNVIRRLQVHNNIIKLYDVHWSLDACWIFMELCTLHNLDRYLENNVDLDIFQKVKIMYQCASAIAFMHNQTPRIIHRDIKLENILMTLEEDNCVVKVTDFGLSKIHEEHTTLSAELCSKPWANTFCGTRFFMAPELFARKGGNSAVDVFSLGLVFAVMFEFGREYMVTVPLSETKKCGKFYFMHPVACRRLPEEEWEYFGEEMLKNYRNRAPMPSMLDFTARQNAQEKRLKRVIRFMIQFKSSDRKNINDVELELAELIGQMNHTMPDESSDLRDDSDNWSQQNSPNRSENHTNDFEVADTHIRDRSNQFYAMDPDRTPHENTFLFNCDENYQDYHSLKEEAEVYEHVFSPISTVTENSKIFFADEYDLTCDFSTANIRQLSVKTERPNSNIQTQKGRRKINSTIILCSLFNSFVFSVVLAVIPALFLHEQNRHESALSGLDFIQLLESPKYLTKELIDDNISGYCFRIVEIDGEIWCMSWQYQFNHLRVYTFHGKGVASIIEVSGKMDGYELKCYILDIIFINKQIIIANNYCKYSHNASVTTSIGLVTIDKKGNINGKPIDAGSFVALTSHGNNLYASVEDQDENTFIRVYNLRNGIWIQFQDFKAPSSPYIKSLIATMNTIYFQSRSYIYLYDNDEYAGENRIIEELVLNTSAIQLSHPKLCQVDSNGNMLMVNNDLILVWKTAISTKSSWHEVVMSDNDDVEADLDFSINFALLDSSGNLWIAKEKTLFKLNPKAT